MKKQFTCIAAILGLGITVSKAQVAAVQVIHNCADAAAATVDIWAGNTLLVNDLAFRNASTTFTNISAGVNIVIGVAPATSTAASQSIATFTVNFAANSRNIVVANGIVSPSGYTPGSSTRPFTLSTFTSALAAAPNATTTSLLVHHGSTDAPTVDIVAPFTGTNPVSPNILVNNASYGAFAGYLNLPTANYKIQVRDQNSENVVAEYTAPLQTLGVGGAALTVLASGFLTPANNSNGAAFGLWVATAAGGSLIPLPTSTISSTRLQAIHNCADIIAAQVDVYLQSAATGTAAIKLIDNFAFRTASSYIDVPVGQTISLFVAPFTSTSSAQAIATSTYNLPATSKFQLIASGIVSPSGYIPGSSTAPFNLTVNANARERSLTANNTDVLVFHGATDAPTVGVAATGAGQLITNLAYGQFASTSYLQLPTNTPAGNYTLHLTNASGSATLASYSAPLNTLGTTGLGLTVLASGFIAPASNSNGPSFGLWAALPAGGNLVQLPVISGLSIKETALNSFVSTYPNPVTDNLFIKNNSSKTGTVKLMDLTGKVISTDVVGEGVSTLNTSNLATGIYFVEVMIDNERMTQKIVK
jgi:hypothetical protein